MIKMTNKKNTFLYLWMDSKNNMWYIGVHLHKDGDDYAHSSTVMESFKYSEKPNYMKRRILKWGTWNDMYNLEQKLISKVSKLQRYYNVDQTPNARKAGVIGGRNNKGKSKLLNHRNNISLSLKGRKHSAETIRKIRESMRGNTNGNGSNQYGKRND